MEIITVPNPILYKKSKKVELIDQEVLDLISGMKKLLDSAEGVGLAAPQVGKSIAVIVTGFSPTKEQLEKNPDLTPVPEIALINPEITWKSKEMMIEKEGCLSVPGKMIPVSRHNKIHLEYLDKNGKKNKLKARGYLARVFQHEIDHLEGKVIECYE